MKRWFLSLGTLLVLGLILLPGSARAVRVGDSQRLAVGKLSGASIHFSFAVDDQGGLWAWGSNDYGQLGQEYIHSFSGDVQPFAGFRYTPVKILDDVASVSCGRNFAMALKTDGTLWVWGNNDNGQLGTNGRNNRNYDYRAPYTGQTYSVHYQDAPVMLMGDVAAITCDQYTAAAIKTDGTLWTWGQNKYGQLGTGKKNSQRSAPVKILDDVAAVSMGYMGGAAVKTDGTLWTWGEGWGGQLMDGWLDSECYTPTQVGVGYRDVLFGSTCAAVDVDDNLWVWGEVDTGCIAGDLHAGDRKHRDGRYQLAPLKIMEDVDRVFAGHTSSGSGPMAAIKTDGSLWVWGCNTTSSSGGRPFSPDPSNCGPLGLPQSGGPYYPPTKLMDNVAELAMWDYTLAIGADGSLWGWGGANPLSKTFDPATGAVGEGVQTTDAAWQTPAQIPHVFPATPAGDAPADDTPDRPTEIVTSGVDPQDAGTAHPTCQTLELQAEGVELAGYALSDGAGGMTTYVRVRDLAWLLKGTQAQFDVTYDGQIALTPNAFYAQPNGTENHAPFQGDWPYRRQSGPTLVNGRSVTLQSFILTDAQGGGHTYYKLRDLAQALGFNVGWSRERGMYLEPDKPYTADD